MILCIWYCVQCEHKRMNSGEIDFIRSLTNESTLRNVPVIIIITQAFDRRCSGNMVNDIRGTLNDNAVDIIPLLASDRVIADENEEKKHILLMEYQI